MRHYAKVECAAEVQATARHQTARRSLL